MLKIKLFALLIVGLMITSCDKDDPEIPNEEELITTVILTLTTEDGSGDPVELTFTDLDGDGGAAPIIQTSALSANTVYRGSVAFLNELESPAEDITEEVIEEDLDHQVFYRSSVSGLNVSYDDNDSEGNPLGVSTMISTSSAGSGTLTITLRHEPNKDGDNVADGDITNAGGETDVEVTFNIDVE
jgi:hypothetical protein